MVDWKDPDVIAYVFFLYDQLAVVLVGLYGCVRVCCCLPVPARPAR